MRARKHLAFGVLVTAAALALAACGSGSSGGGSGSGAKVQLALVAYSTPQGAYTKLIKAFQATPAGKNITFTQSYGASGDQSRAVAAGLKADIVNFSLEPDMTRLVKANLVAADWNAGPVQGHDHRLGRRDRHPQGQPEEHQGLDRPDQVRRPGHHAEPVHLRRRALEHHGRVRRRTPDKGTNKQAGVDYLNALFKNVPVQDDSARKSIQTFVGGKGDAFLSYESEAINAQNEQPARRLHGPELDDPDREPDRGHLDHASTRRRPRRSWTSCTPRRRSRSGPTPATGRSCPAWRPASSRRPASCSPSTTSAAGRR